MHCEETDELIGLIKKIDPNDEFFIIETENNESCHVTELHCTSFCWNNKHINARVLFEKRRYGDKYFADNCYLENEQYIERCDDENLKERSAEEYRGEQIEDIISKKKITKLYHFTKISNLKSILENGIVPRCTIDDGFVNGEINDTKRLDECKDATCVSIIVNA